MENKSSVVPVDNDYTVTTWEDTSRRRNVSGLFCKKARCLQANLGGKTGRFSYLSSISTKFLAKAIQLKSQRMNKFQLKKTRKEKFVAMMNLTLTKSKTTLVKKNMMKIKFTVSK